MSDHYQTLGVARDASDEQIKRAFRRLAMHHHPDRGGDAEQFKKVEEAYRVLSDPRSRAQYDTPQHQGFQFHFNQGSPFDFDSIFDIFGAKFQQAPQRPQARLQINLTLRDIVTAQRRPITIRTPQGEQTVTLDIPAGVEDGEQIRYPNLAPGDMDLVVQFRIEPDAKWTRRGATVYTDCKITIWEAIQGAQIPVQGLRGEHLEITVPPHSQPGTQLRLRGRGLLGRDGVPGDMIIRLQPEIPDSISAELEAAIAREIQLQQNSK